MYNMKHKLKINVEGIIIMKNELLKFSEKSKLAKLYVEYILKDVGIKVKRDVLDNLEFNLDINQYQVLPKYFKDIDFYDTVSELHVHYTIDNFPTREQIKSLKNDFTQLVSSF